MRTSFFAHLCLSIPTSLLVALLFSVAPLPLYASNIPVDTTVNGMADDGSCSLVEAILAANTNTATGGCPAGDDSPSDTIVLAANATYNLTEAFDFDPEQELSTGLTGLPSITTTITLSGNGATIVRGANVAFRILHVSFLGNLTLRDITLRNGSADSGGAIYSEGILNVENSHIVGNWAVTAGGGIYISSEGEAKIINSEIADNSAEFGGGIYNYLATLVIENSNLEGNAAELKGGALHNIAATTTVLSSTVVSNSANLGGAFFNFGRMVITSADMIANMARETGGAFYHEDLLGSGFGQNYGVEISHSRLLDNRALINGSALHITGGLGLINESCIVGNSPIAVLRTGGPRFDATNNWWGSSDGPHGGGGTGKGDTADDFVIVDEYKSSAILECPDRPPVRETYLPHATYNPSGHLITVTTTIDFDVDGSDGNCTLIEAILAANTNSSQDKCPAGSQANDIIVLDEDATYSLVQSYADYWGLTGLPSITSVMTIRGNGAIIERSGSEQFRFLHVAAAVGNLTLENVTLRYGSEVRGGAIYNRGTLTLDNSRILSNTASVNGGGIFNGSTINLVGQIESEGKTVTRNGTIIAFNHAERGGGIYNIDSGLLSLADTDIASNRAIIGGGMFNGDSATLMRVRIISNHADENGGGVGGVGTLTMLDSAVVGNMATNQGGGLYLGTRTLVNPPYQPALYIFHSRLLNNEAGMDGGALYSVEGFGRIHQNCIVGNSSMAVTGSTLGWFVHLNWWGAANGPSGGGPGSGDSIAEDFIFSPFLTEAILECPSSAASE